MRLSAAFILGLLATALAVPAVMRIAWRLDLLDRPLGWKSHAQPTPYLGGAALLFGFSISASVFVQGPHLPPILACCFALCALGTLDDRWGLTASTRVAATAIVAVWLWVAGLGWSIFSDDLANFLLSVLWLVAVVNAVNLLDLLDGAAATTVAACAAACAAMAGVLGDNLLLVLGLALSGACLGFLRHNLRSPSRIFLGDGGTMPLGLLLGVLTETLPWGKASALGSIGGAVLLCGVPLFDMAFRVFSRLRRGDTLLTAGPDSVANWLAARLPSVRWVAVVLGTCQAALGGLAVVAADRGDDALGAAGLCALALGVVLIVALDASGFGHHLARTRPPGGRARVAAVLDDASAAGPLIGASSHVHTRSEHSAPQ